MNTLEQKIRFDFVYFSNREYGGVGERGRKMQIYILSVKVTYERLKIVHLVHARKFFPSSGC